MTPTTGAGTGTHVPPDSVAVPAAPAGTGEPSAGPGRTPRAAQRVTDGMEPKNWIVAVSLAIGWQADRLPGLAWGALAALFAGAIPMVWIAWGRRRGLWGDRHARRRQDRLILLPGVVVSVVAGTVVLDVLGAPRELLALVAAMLTTLLAILAITLFWKISVHTAVSSGSVVLLSLAYGPWLLALYPVVAAVAWSRVRLRDHTRGQVAAGTVLGAVAAGLVFAALRG